MTWRARPASAAVGREAARLLLAALLASGCAARTRSHGVPNAVPERGAFAALVPLDNLTDTPDASRRYTQLLFDAVAGDGGLELVSPAAVEAVLARHRVRRSDLVDAAVYRSLREETGARYALLGAVLDLNEPSAARSGQAEVTVTLRLLDLDSGRVLWSCNDARSGADAEGPFGWGVVGSADQLARRSAEQVAADLRAWLGGR